MDHRPFHHQLHYRVSQLPLAPSRGGHWHGEGGEFGVLLGEDFGEGARPLASSSLVIRVKVLHVDGGTEAEAGALCAGKRGTGQFVGDGDDATVSVNSGRAQALTGAHAGQRRKADL